MANKQTTEERFDERFGVIQKYHPSYWGAPDKDGTQIAVPSKITEESENIKSFINSEKALAIAEERKNPNTGRNSVWYKISGQTFNKITYTVPELGKKIEVYEKK